MDMHVVCDRPAPETLKGRMRDLAAGFRDRAVAAEQARRVPAASLNELRDAGLLRIVQPRRFGGQEQDFDLLADLVIEAARGCASTGWVYGLYAAHHWLAAGFPAQAQHDLWDEDPDATICGSYAPAGTARTVPGGWELTGRWEFASGCDGATWALCSAMLPAAEGQPPAPAFLLVPRRDWAIDDGWHVAGLAASGSATLVLEAVFVPGHRALTFRESTSGDTPGARLHDTPLYRMPMLSNIPSCLAATAVGAAGGALDHYVETSGGRETRGAVAGGGRRMAEFATIQLRVADAAACVDAAREVLLRDLRLRMQSARVGETVSVAERITSRRGQAFAVALAIRAAEALNAATGGYGLALVNPVQRAWRDANAVGRHISLNWDSVGTMYGQMALGLEPKGQY